MILCSGCFDGLHAGHVEYLQRAMAQRRDGEPVVVAVAPHAYLFDVKGRTPSWSLEDRMFTVAAMTGVDRVVAHGATGAEDVIRELRPRVFIKAADWKDRLTNAVLKACFDSGTSILFVPERGATPHTSQVA